MDRRRLAICSFSIVALALTALPAVASARIAYFTGNSGFTGIAAPVELSTQTADPADQVTVGISSESAPADVAITPDGRTAYVVDDGDVTPIDVATDKAGTPIPIPSSGRSIAITPDGRFAYVASSFSAPEEVVKIDLATGAVVAEIPVGHNLFGLAVNTDGRTVYVVSSNDGSVYPIDVATNAVGAPIVVGAFPSAIAVTPDGASAYVVVSGEEKLVRIRLATNTVVGAIPNVPGFELAISPSGAKAYVIGSGEVTPVDLAAGAAGTPSSSPNQNSFEDVAFLPDGSRAYTTTQAFQMSSFEGLMTPIAAAGDTLEAAFPLNAPTVRALAIVPNQPPRAAFEPSPAQVAVGQTVGFANTSADTDGGSIARYEWDFGDGTVIQNGGATPQHTYAKSGTYQVTLTVTDNEGCSVSVVFTGQTAYCNGSAIARTTRSVKVGLEICPRVKASASTFVPKRRPGNVLPGVRVRLASGVPSKLNVTANLIYRREGEEASAGLGKVSVTVNKWRRIRFAIPAQLRQELPIGTRVKVALRIETMPRNGNPCEATVVLRTIKVHIVKVFPNRVQFARPR